MVVRVKVRVRPRTSHESVDLVVLANGGAESPRPCLVVDEEMARKLKLWPSSEFKLHQVEEASSISEAYLIDEAIELELLGDDGEILARTIADLVIQRGLMEPLITDITIDELGIQVISFSRGLWRHKNDPPDKIRRSSQPPASQ